MTLRCVSIQPGDMSAEDYRAALAAVMAPAGVDVSQTGYVPGAVATVAVSGLTATVSAFRGFIQGTSAQGLYEVSNSADMTKTLDAGGTQDRIDAIVARVRNDDYDSSGDNDFDITVLKGTEATSPVAPTLDTTDLLIADVTVPAGASTGDGLTTDNVDYSRQPCYTEALGAIHVARQNDPDGAYAGAYRDNAGVLERWSGSAWGPAAITAPAARLYYGGTGQQINSGTSAQLTGLTTDYAFGGMTVASNAITVPVAGVYSIQARVAFNGTSSGMPPTGRYICSVYLNGSAAGNEVVRWEEVAGGTDYPTPNGATSLKLNAGDTLTLWGYQNTGNNNVFSRGSAAAYHACYLNVALVSQ